MFVVGEVPFSGSLLAHMVRLDVELILRELERDSAGRAARRENETWD